MKGNVTVLSSRVRLARNYEDLPFDVTADSELADMCISRTMNALRLAGAEEGFVMLRLDSLTEQRRRMLMEQHLISEDLLRHTDSAAVLLKEDESLSIMINEDDHLRIQANTKGLNLRRALDSCFRIEDALSRQVTFAFDRPWGYLTSCPTNTGTGMRASLLMHLPQLTACKQMGNVGQIVAKLGLTIRGVYGEGSEALGNLYQVSNQVTLGRTEQDLINAVTAVGHQLTDMELQLRDKAMADDRVATEDDIYRAWGLMRHARLMDIKEFYELWSDVRMGAAMELLPVSPETLDRLLDDVQDNTLRASAGETRGSGSLRECRAARIRAALGGSSFLADGMTRA